MRSRAAAESRRPVLLLVCSTVFFRPGLAGRNNSLPVFPCPFLQPGVPVCLRNQTNLATSVEHFVSVFLAVAFAKFAKSVKNKPLHNACGIYRLTVFKTGAELGTLEDIAYA